MELPNENRSARADAGHAARVRASRLEHAVGHRSAADERAEAAEFERGLRAIASYAARHGTTDVPRGYADESGFPLAVWVATQREEHLEQRLEDHRHAALEGVPGWQWSAGPGGRAGGAWPE